MSNKNEQVDERIDRIFDNSDKRKFDKEITDELIDEIFGNTENGMDHKNEE